MSDNDVPAARNIPPVPPLPDDVNAPADPPRRRIRIPFGLTAKQLTLVGISLIAVLLVGAVAGALITTSVLTPRIDAQADHVVAVTQERDDALEKLSRAQDGRRTAEETVGKLVKEKTDAEAALADREAQVKAREDAVQAREDAVTQTEQQVAANSFGNGTHRVNVDISPGTYRRDGSGDCYWARLRGGGGTIDDIIANGLPTGPATVTISGSDWGFQSEMCGTWTKVE